MASYRLKILLQIDLPVRDDAAARQIAHEAVVSLGLNELDSLGRPVDLPRTAGLATITLVCEDSKDGRNLMAAHKA